MRALVIVTVAETSERNENVLNYVGVQVRATMRSQLVTSFAEEDRSSIIQEGEKSYFSDVPKVLARQVTDNNSGSVLH